MGDWSGKGQGQEDYGFIVLYLVGKVIPKLGEVFSRPLEVENRHCLFPTEIPEVSPTVWGVGPG